MISFSSLGSRASVPTIARLMTLALENPNLLSLAAGFTDNGSLPMDTVARLSAELLTQKSDPEALQYGTNQGRPGLRRLVATRFEALETGNVSIEPSQIIISNGSQQALYLAMQVLADPGDIVLVDRPSYFVFLEMLLGLGLRPVSIPVDEAGVVDAAAFADLLREIDRRGERSRVKALYFVSYFSNPSSRSLSLDEKRSMARVLVSGGWTIPVLEDAAYRELYFSETPPAPSLFSLPEWSAFPKLYLATLTKPFSTGLKVGYAISSDQTLLDKMLFVKGHHDFGSANFNQAVLEKALGSGAYDHQLARLRPVYSEKSDVLHRALVAEGLRERGWSWQVPTGGLYLWLKGPSCLDTGLASEFCRTCIREGVLYVPGDLCFGDRAPHHFARLSFGVLPPPLLEEAAQRFGRASRLAERPAPLVAVG